MLHEKYRPKTWREVLGQNDILSVVAGIKKREGTLAGRAYWISGKSGQGKTTIARLIAGEIAEGTFIEELDSQGLTPARIRDAAMSLRYTAFGRGGRVIIVNESHGLTATAIRQLLVELERIPRHVAWIFTTTLEGQQKLFDGIDAGPLLSRCVPLALAQRGLSDLFAVRAKEIAQLEGLDGAPLEKYKLWFKRDDNSAAFGGNMRALLEAVEAGEFCESMPAEAALAILG